MDRSRTWGLWMLDKLSTWTRELPEMWATIPGMATSPLCNYAQQVAIPPSFCHLNNLWNFNITLHITERNTKQAWVKRLPWACLGSSKYAFTVKKDFGFLSLERTVKIMFYVLSLLIPHLELLSHDSLIIRDRRGKRVRYLFCCSFLGFYHA